MKCYKKCIILLCFILFSSKVQASTKLAGIENFPNSYRPYLIELKNQHPNWNFVALYTGLDWNTVIDEEYGNDKNLVPLSYLDVWKCKDEEKYNIEIDNGWVNASKEAIEYTMDPRNFLNSVRVFQFELLAYDENTHTKDGIERILYGTEFYKRDVKYKDEEGNTITTDKTYSDLILDAGIYAGVSPFHLASRIRQELGVFLSHKSISGDVPGYEGLYNFYNIGATSSVEELGAIKNGLQYARDGKDASESVKANYMIPWDSPEKAIKGGAVFIGSSYILKGQYNLYLQKFDVNNENKNDLFWHQYMTNCLASYSESYNIYRAYYKNNLLDSDMTFVIPVYDNMPEDIAKRPDILDSDYENDNKKVYVSASNNINIMSGPSTSYEILTTVNKDEHMTRIAKGIQKGEKWDRVKLENGMIGYVFQSYIKEVEDQPQEPDIPNIEDKIESITLQLDNDRIEKGTTEEIKVTILPEKFENSNLIWESSNTQIATVDNGTITAISDGETIITAKSEDGVVSNSINITVYTKEENIDPPDIPNLPDDNILKFDEKLEVNENTISNIDINNSTVKEIRELIETNLTIEFYNYKDVLLEDEQRVGTGSKLVLKNSKDEIINEYEFIIYGDVNGDGLINALDALIIQKHVLEIKELTGLFIIAGNTNKNGNLPSSLDILRIQKHILEIKFIEQ